MSYKPFYEKKRTVLFDLFDKFPDLSIRGTAAILIRDYPEYFNDYEEARNFIRYFRGKKGKKLREDNKIKKYYR